METCVPWRFKNSDLEAVFTLAFLGESLARFVPFGRVLMPIVGIIDGQVFYVRFSESHVWSLTQILTYLVIRPVQVVGLNFLLWYADKIPSKYHVGLGITLLWSYRIFIVYFIAQELELGAQHHPAHRMLHTIWTPFGAAVLLPTFEEHILGALAIVAAKPILFLVVGQCFNQEVLIEFCVRVGIAFVGIYLNYEVHGRRRENWISSSRYGSFYRVVRFTAE